MTDIFLIVRGYLGQTFWCLMNRKRPRGGQSCSDMPISSEQYRPRGPLVQDRFDHKKPEA